MLMPSVRATSCSVRRPSIHFSTTIARFSSLFVKVICSLSILTFSRNSYTLTISQNNNNSRKKRLSSAVRYGIVHLVSMLKIAVCRRVGKPTLYVLSRQRPCISGGSAGERSENPIRGGVVFAALSGEKRLRAVRHRVRQGRRQPFFADLRRQGGRDRRRGMHGHFRVRQRQAGRT